MNTDDDDDDDDGDDDDDAMMIHNMDKELFKGKKEACLHVVAQETWLVGGSVCIPI